MTAAFLTSRLGVSSSGRARAGHTRLALRLGCIAVSGFLLLAARAAAGELVDYARQVKPILRQRCYPCHGALKRQAGLRLDSGARIRRGGDGGPAVEPGKAGESLLIDRVAETDSSLRMPPEGAPLSREQIALLSAWIDQGARSPVDEEAEKDPRKHWAFLTPVRPPVPAVKAAAWPRNPIDGFLAAEHERRGLTPLPPASPEVLLRRVSLDLTGLPPTRAQLHEFLADPSDAAYERLVDRLLASPQYGERWARHWMDVWRYSDWYGRRAVPDVLNSYAMIWRWRDWIIRALNRDAGYDWMVRQMLAADELNPTDEENLAATGYIVRNFYRWNYNTWMKDNVEHTAKAFLGLTIQCAYCHDHKYDPIRQEDYFALRACFEPIEIRHDRVAGEPDPGPYPKYDYGKAYAPITSGRVRVFDEKLDAATYLFTRGESRNIVPGKPPIAPGVPAFLRGGTFRVEPVSLPVESAYPGLKSFVRGEEAAKCAARVALCEHAQARLTEGASRAERDLSAAELFAARVQFHSLQARIAADLVRHGKASGDFPTLARAAARSERLAAFAEAKAGLARAELARSEAQAKARKDPGAQGELSKAEQLVGSARKAVEAAQQRWEKERGTNYAPLGPTYPARSTGRRTALARWITDPQNPLAARVAVNHIWRWHFQQPLVATTHDLGRNGKRPTHPELLDWLATELVARGWSMKALHRLIVTSSAYRMASHAAVAGGPNQDLDPENQAYWRFPRARLEAELVRDGLLAAAETLDLAQGGPDIDFQQGFTSRRRSLYLTHHGEGRMPFLELFDAPDACDAYTRTVSVIPQQPLALVNNELARSLSRAIADHLSAVENVPSASPASFVTAAFEQVLNRPPSPLERERSIEFLAGQEALFLRADPSGPTRGNGKSLAAAARARGNLVHALFNHNDFLTIH